MNWWGKKEKKGYQMKNYIFLTSAKSRPSPAWNKLRIIACRRLVCSKFYFELLSVVPKCIAFIRDFQRTESLLRESPRQFWIIESLFCRQSTASYCKYRTRAPYVHIRAAPLRNDRKIVLRLFLSGKNRQTIYRFRSFRVFDRVWTLRGTVGGWRDFEQSLKKS